MRSSGFLAYPAATLMEMVLFPSEDRLYSRRGHLWRSFRKRFHRQTSLCNAGGDFEPTQGIVVDVPEDLERAEISEFLSIHGIRPLVVHANA